MIIASLLTCKYYINSGLLYQMCQLNIQQSYHYCLQSNTYQDWKVCGLVLSWPLRSSVASR